MTFKKSRILPKYFTGRQDSLRFKHYPVLKVQVFLFQEAPFFSKNMCNSADLFCLMVSFVMMPTD